MDSFFLNKQPYIVSGIFSNDNDNPIRGGMYDSLFLEKRPTHSENDVYVLKCEVNSKNSKSTALFLYTNMSVICGITPELANELQLDLENPDEFVTVQAFVTQKRVPAFELTYNFPNGKSVKALTFVGCNHNQIGSIVARQIHIGADIDGKITYGK